MKRPGTALLFLILLAVFAVLLTPRVIQVWHLQERSNNLETEIRKLSLENQRLELQLKELREDPVYLEKVAREKFNKAKQGEIVYKVVREDDGPKSP